MWSKHVRPADWLGFDGLRLIDANGKETAAARTNPKGEFEFAAIPAGAYTMTAAKPGSGSGSVPIRVAAGEKLYTRVYPVGDLVMGPLQLQQMARSGGGGIGGGAGGIGGGAGGAGGGLGGGGLGGGGGGLGGGGLGGGGGGLFSVPSEESSDVGTQPAAAARSKTFGNDAVQASKKKRSDAR